MGAVQFQVVYRPFPGVHIDPRIGSGSVREVADLALAVDFGGYHADVAAGGKGPEGIEGIHLAVGGAGIEGDLRIGLESAPFVPIAFSQSHGAKGRDDKQSGEQE